MTGDDWSDRLDELFRQEIFLTGDGSPAEDRNVLTYRRLRAVAEALGLDRELAADPDRLHPLLARAAVTDPSLFHVLGVHMGAGIGVIAQYGGAAAHDLLARLESGAAVACVLITEEGRGSSHIAQRTHAVFDPTTRDFVLDSPDDGAHKLPCTAGLSGVPKIGVTTAAVVVGGVERGVFSFAVELSDENGARPGVTITPLAPSLLLPGDHAAVSFRGVRVPFDHWLADGARIDASGGFRDRLGDPDARLLRTLGFVSNMQAGASAGAAAVARAAVGSAIREAYQRTTMGRLNPGATVISYRTHQQALFPALATAYALGRLVEHARSTHPNAAADLGAMSSSPWAAANRLTALVKVRATEAAAEVVRTCLTHGTAQTLLTSPLAAYQGLVQGYALAAGSNQLIKLDAGRAMAEGSGYQPPDTALANRGSRDLLDPELWPHLLCSREALLHGRLVESLEDGAADGNEFARWNPRMPTAVELADAHLDRLMLECVLAGTGAVKDAAGAGAEPLCALVAIELIRPHLGWYLCAGLLGTGQANLVDNTLASLCDRIAPRGRALAEFALGIRPPGHDGGAQRTK